MIEVLTLIYSYERYKTPECVNISSRRRKIRADKLHRPTNLKEFLETLSDNGDEKYPIFRDIREDDPIELKTISTGKMIDNLYCLK